MGCDTCPLKNSVEVPYRGNLNAEIIVIGECYSDDTEILTINGWKPFSDVQLSELCYSLNPETGNIELVPTIKIIKKPFTGNLHHFSSSSVDLLVTPEHLLYAATSHTRNFKLQPLSRIKSKTFEMTSVGNWDSASEFDTYYMKFLGMWLGDGMKEMNNGGYRVRFGFKKERKIAYLEELLTNMRIHYKKWVNTTSKTHMGKTYLDIYNKDLYQWLPDGKYIPDFVFQLSRKSQLALLDGILESDGNKKTLHIYQSNKRLIDDIQRLCFLCSIPSTLTYRDRDDQIGREIIPGYPIKSIKRAYTLILKSKSVPFTINTNKNFDYVPYDGFVWDVTLEKNHILVVRRNGRVLFSSNSPGAQEIRQGQPFVGPSGQLLMEQLQFVGIDHESVFYANSARCQIDKDNLSGREVKAILSSCRPKLEIAIKDIKPKVLILCGAIALEQVTKLKGIKTKRGKWLWSNEFNCHIMPTWHPAYILRNQTELENFRSDLQKVARLRLDGWEFDDNDEFVYHEVDTILPLLRGGFMRDDGTQKPIQEHRVIRTKAAESSRPFVTAIDSETQGLSWWDPNSIIISYSVAVNYREAWNIYLHEEVPLEEADFTIKVCRGGTKAKPTISEIGIKRVFGYDRKVEELRELCMRQDIKKYFANLKYEKHRFYNLGITELNNAPMDVMLASHTLDSERFLNNTLSQLIDCFTNLKFNLKDSLSEAEKSDMLLTIRNKRDVVNKYACLQKGSTVRMADGSRKPIDYLVKNKITDPVMSYNESIGVFEPKPITGWYRNVHKENIDWHFLVTTVSQKGGKGYMGAKYTPDHKILTSKGWVEAKDIKIGDKIATPYESLSPTQQQIILGGLLGDGCIYIKNKDSGFGQFIVQHCDAQKEYIEWTTSMLETSFISCTNNIPAKEMIIDGYHTTGTKHHRMSTIHHPALRDLYNIVYPEGKKSVGDWVYDLDLLGLAVWYMDDGTLVREKSIRLYTNGFDLQSMIKLSSVLLRNFGLIASWYKDKRRENQYILTLEVEQSIKFFDLICEYIHPSMQYKLPPLYRDKFKRIEYNEMPSSYYSEVLAVRHVKGSRTRRGTSKVSYCIDVLDNHNFLTQNEVVHNCFDALSTLHVANTLRGDLSKDEKSLKYYVNFIHPTECDLLFEMERNGVLIDTNELPIVKEHIKQVMQDKVDEFKKLCPNQVIQRHDHDFKLTRRIILTDALFDFTSTTVEGEEEVHNFGYHMHPIAISNKSRMPTCDKDALTQLLDSQRTPDRAKDLILAYREWSDHNTLLTRYVKNIEENIGPDNRLHPGYSIKFTSSGRTGARNPSIQNFPKRGPVAKLIRRLIIAPPGKVLMEVDHSMSELRWVAHVANERKMKEIFQNNGDIHLTTGLEVAGIRTAEQKGALSPELLKQIRQSSKAINFGFVYGMSAGGFKNYARSSYHMKLTDAQAQEYRDTYFSLYRDLPLWHTDCASQIRNYGYIRTLFGRKRSLPNAFSPDRAAIAEAVRIGTNVVIQGPSSDATLMGGNNILADKRLDKNEASINIFIHDALIFEIDEDKIEKYANIVRDCMENIDTKTYGFSLTVPLIVEAEYGKNLAEMTKLKF